MPGGDDHDVPAGFLAEEPDRPFVMLNLLRFADGGRERYRQYTRALGRP
ncbi:hypothetical protein O7627_19355 [Solwaraspora sp. WMMD1047]|nr:hypothetical protein [Solwaraspora sp. WMMD1047]MDG4831458.1 hypothetical protein [Solwaraspora sp. WMMD1047]